MIDIVEIKNWLKENLREGRYLHSLGAQETAVSLAKRFGADVEKASLAALVHDCAKCIPNDELYKLIEENNIPVTEMELLSVKTLHSPVGAWLAEQKFGITDKQVLSAIRYHTIGRVGMDIIEKIVFLSDKVEAKTRNKNFRSKVLDLLEKTGDIDSAILACYEATIRRLLERKMIFNPQTVEVYNSLLLKNT